MVQFCYVKISMIAEKLLEKIFINGQQNHAILLICPDTNSLELEKDKIIKRLKILPQSLIEIGAGDDKNLDTGIDEIKNLLKTISRSSTTTSRLVVIKNANKLTSGAANCLLKTLEDPPLRTYFLLLATNKNIIQTILSRCQTYYFPNIVSEPYKFSSLEINKIKNMSLKEKFDFGDQLIKKGELDKFLVDLKIYYKNEFINNISDKNIIQSLLISEKHLKANVQPRIIAENLLLLLS